MYKPTPLFHTSISNFCC